MIDNFYEIDGVKYAIDVKKLFDYVAYATKKNVIEKEIEDTYCFEDDIMTPRDKIVKEYTRCGDTQIDNIRYDFVKTLISYLFQADTEEIAHKISFNTLLNEGLLIIVE